MTPDDTDIVLSAMAAMWPSHTATPDETRLWHLHLDDVGYEDAMAVLVQLEQVTRHWPHWSEFVAVYQPLVKRRIERQRQTEAARALAAPTDRDRTAALIAECRAVLAGPRVVRVRNPKTGEVRTIPVDDTWRTRR